MALIFATGDISAQGKKTTRLQVEYYKNHDKMEMLIATLIAKERRYVPLAGAMIRFYSVNDTSKALLEELVTNDEGKVVLKINDNSKIFYDPSGIMTFEVEYGGNSSYKSVQRQISVKRANLDVFFFQKDSIKSIEVNASEIGPDNLITPIQGLHVRFYIKGTFSLLDIGKEKTDQYGNARIDFPVYMPGDTAGVIKIVVKIEDDDDYGTIESRGEINWGIPVKVIKKERRGLGDTDAPLWMVYTLIILLSAVWFHYLYVIYMIIKIKLAR